MTRDPNPFRHKPTLILAGIGGAFLLTLAAGVAFVIQWANSSSLPGRLAEPPMTAEERLAEASEAPSIAVVPLVLDAGSDVNANLVETVTEGIANRMDQEGFRVAYGQSVEQFRNRQGLTAAEVAEALGVRYVLIGSVGGAGEELRISAVLHDVVLGMSVFRGSFYGDRVSVSSLHDEVVASLLAVLDNIRG